MRFHLRTLMLTVVIAALVLGWVVHARGVIVQEKDNAFNFLMVEGFAATVILVGASLIRFVIRAARKDRAYARWRQRKDVPLVCHFPIVRSALPSCRHDGDA
jgi:hypothetical protein